MKLTPTAGPEAPREAPTFGASCAARSADRDIRYVARVESAALSRASTVHMTDAAMSWVIPPAMKDQRTLVAVASAPATSAPITMVPLVKIRAVTLTRPRRWFGVSRCCILCATGR